MATWRIDEGLNALIVPWKEAHPGAVVYTIGDSDHSTDPDQSQHAPDDGGPLPGDDKGEVDAADFMPGKGGVTDEDLDDLAEQLRVSEDKRLLYVIRRNRIFSSVVQPFKWRPYKGAYHTHTHVSVNDLFDNNTSPWEWEKLVAETWKYKKVEEAQLPELLKYGQEDAMFDGWNHIVRVQALLPVFAKGEEALEFDGVYGAKTTQMVKKVFGGNGKVLTFEAIKKLHGLN